MLRNLEINNIVLIDKNEIEFANGLNVLSGETGAGKSIIIHSLKFLMGDRADTGMIRAGETEAFVRAVFDLEIKKDSLLKEVLDDLEIDYEDNQLIIERRMVLDGQGRNSCKINGQKVTLSMLKNLTANLIDICGQHENTKLLDPKSHVGILDLYGGNEIIDLKNILKNNIVKLREINKELSRLKNTDNFDKLSRKEDLIIMYQEAIDKINAIATDDNEYKELEEKNEVFENSQFIISSINNTISALDNEEVSTLSTMRDAVYQLSQVSNYSKELTDFLERLESLNIEIQEIKREIEQSLTNYEFDEDEANRVYERLNDIRVLIKRYGDKSSSLESVYKYRDFAQEKLEDLTQRDEKIVKLELDKSKLLNVIKLNVDELFKLRTKVGNNLSKQVSIALEELNMQGSEFAIRLTDLQDEDIESFVLNNKFNDVSFVIKTNVGSEFKELYKIISGGEMSRIMLAIKNIIYDQEEINTVVFDEIDSGISGKTAIVVGDKLKKLSRAKQILLISHLPQIVSKADTHYLISKFVKDLKTYSNIKQLDYQGRKEELARLISGDEKSELALMQAEELLKLR